MKSNTVTRIATFVAIVVTFSNLTMAAVPRPLAGPVRDLRKEIDFKRIGEFHLGPTGAMGWMHVSKNSMTPEARQILITKVEAGCPADGVLEEGGLVCWGYGYHNLLLTEYYLTTGDDYVLPAIREYAIKVAMGQSSAGTWGHGFAWKITNDGKLHGRLRGYGAVNQAGLPCFLSLILARKCGVDHPEVEAAIERSSQFFENFVGHGSIGYGFHRPSLEINANGSNGMSGNGKNGVAAVAFRLLGEDKATRFFTRLTASLTNTMAYGHSGNSYSYFWDGLGANCGGPEMAAAFLKELRWYHALTRKPDGRFVYQQLGGIYGRVLLDPTAAQVLIATLPRKALYITGKEMDQPLLTTKEISQTIDAGNWRMTDPKSVSADELIGELDNWSPIAREWIAKHLGPKKGNFTPQLIELLKSDKPEARAGACAALGYQGEKAGAAVELLAQALRDDPVVAIPASYALARINKPAAKVMPEILSAMLDREEDGEMRPVHQAMAFGFGYKSGRYAPLYFDGILPGLAKGGNPLERVDRKLLHPVLVKLLDDPSGRTRGSAAFAFEYFSREDLAELAQEIHDTVAKSAPHYRMFSDDARQQALNLLLKFEIAEGIPLALESIDLQEWGSGERLPHRWKILKAYGGSAKPYLPRLHAMRTEFKEGSDRRKELEEVITTIEKSQEAPALVSPHSLVDEKLARDLGPIDNKDQKVAACRSLVRENPENAFYQAACLRQLVALQGEGAREVVEQALKSNNKILREEAEKLRADKNE